MKKFSTSGSHDDAAHRVTVIGVDLAKNVFALHGINAAGVPVLIRPNVRRDQLLNLLAQLPPCVIGMEACSGAHQLARSDLSKRMATISRVRGRIAELKKVFAAFLVEAALVRHLYQAQNDD